jgi:hypothetical protein
MSSMIKYPAKNFCHQLLILLVVLFIPLLVSAQEMADTGCVQKDLADVIRGALHKPPKNKSSSSGSLLIVPVIGSNPATGVIFGVSTLYAFKMPGSSMYSNFIGTAQVTTKSQIIFMVRNSIYTRSEKIFLTGDWRYLKYSQSTYGLGTTSPEGGLLDYQYNLAGVETIHLPSRCVLILQGFIRLSLSRSGKAFMPDSVSCTTVIQES